MGKVPQRSNPFAAPCITESGVSPCLRGGGKRVPPASWFGTARDVGPTKLGRNAMDEGTESRASLERLKSVVLQCNTVFGPNLPVRRPTRIQCATSIRGNTETAIWGLSRECGAENCRSRLRCVGVSRFGRTPRLRGHLSVTSSGQPYPGGSAIDLPSTPGEFQRTVRSLVN
jgi:hypothetical protein